MDRVSRRRRNRGSITTALGSRRWSTAWRISLSRGRRCTCWLTTLGISVNSARRGCTKWWRCRCRSILCRTWSRAWLITISGLRTRTLLRSRLWRLSSTGCRRSWIVLRWNIICICLRRRRRVTTRLSTSIRILRWWLRWRLLVIRLWARTTILSWLLLLATRWEVLLRRISRWIALLIWRWRTISCRWLSTSWWWISTWLRTITVYRSWRTIIWWC